MNELEKAVDNFNKAQKAKTYSERHPEVGRMINCQVCSNRHRSIIVCQPRTVALPADTFKGRMGAASVKGKRLIPRGKKND